MRGEGRGEGDGGGEGDEGGRGQEWQSDESCCVLLLGENVHYIVRGKKQAMQ